MNDEKYLIISEFKYQGGENDGELLAVLAGKTETLKKAIAISLKTLTSNKIYKMIDWDVIEKENI